MCVVAGGRGVLMLWLRLSLSPRACWCCCRRLPACLLALKMLGSPDKRYVCLGPASGFSDHYGACGLLHASQCQLV